MSASMFQRFILASLIERVRTCPRIFWLLDDKDANYIVHGIM